MVVLTVDGLRARALGCYGNTWFGTPAIDELASGGRVFDRVLAESTDLEPNVRAWWTGRHALDQRGEAAVPLMKQLADEGYLCRLVTDDRAISAAGESAGFDEVTCVGGEVEAPAAEVFDTAIGRALETAADVLGEWSAEYEQPRLLWVHLRGMMAPWDAPTEFAEQLRDEDDPVIEASIEVPDSALPDGRDADAAFLAGCRYAAQVMTLDRTFGALDNLLGELWPESPATVVLAGTRGFALGEHGVVGLGEIAYREQFHVPLVVRAAGVPATTRSASLLQTSDLHRLLLQLATNRPLAPAERMVAVGRCHDSMYLETEEWSYVADGESSPRLFVQPDDAWQANDVASLCPSEVQRLETLRTQVTDAAAAGDPWHRMQPATRED